MIVKRIDPLSLAKVSAVLYALMGFIVGCCIGLFSLLGLAADQGPEPAVFGLIFGAGAVVVFPIFYGALGFLGSLVMAALYNVAVRFTGGIVLEMEDASRNRPGPTV